MSDDARRLLAYFNVEFAEAHAPTATSRIRSAKRNNNATLKDFNVYSSIITGII
jgi:hypothetical protein